VAIDQAAMVAGCLAALGGAGHSVALEALRALVDPHRIVSAPGKNDRRPAV
jgi:hypothetical protein